jgi:hypothetical protein
VQILNLTVVEYLLTEMASLPNQPPALAAPVSEWKAKSLEDLERIIPNRVDLHFDPLPELDNTATLEWEFGILLWKTYEASLQYFGGGDGNFPSQTSPWLHQFPPEFYSYVEAVAHPDPYAGQWEDLLVNEAERVFLVTAIIMKALHTHVLSTLTFGADAEHEKVVNLEDSSLVEIDGGYIYTTQNRRG